MNADWHHLCDLLLACSKLPVYPRKELVLTAGVLTLVVDTHRTTLDLPTLLAGGTNSCESHRKVSNRERVFNQLLLPRAKQRSNRLRLQSLYEEAY